MTLLWLALAGGLGAVIRFVVDAEAARLTPGRIPAGTLVVNVTGSLLLGLLTGWWMSHGGTDDLRAVLGTGFLGGYTTFSTASVEASRLTGGGRPLAALAHAAGMLLTSIFAAAVGVWLTSG